MNRIKGTSHTRVLGEVEHEVDEADGHELEGIEHGRRVLQQELVEQVMCEEHALELCTMSFATYEGHRRWSASRDGEQTAVLEEMLDSHGAEAIDAAFRLGGRAAVEAMVRAHLGLEPRP